MLGIRSIKRHLQIGNTCYNRSFLFKDVLIEKNQKKQRIPNDPSTYGFGKYFSNHMIDIDWDSKSGWFPPKISPFRNFSIHPSAKSLHYAIEVFEGLKAYTGVDGKIRVFRPELNMERMQKSAMRSCLPYFDANEALLLIDEMIRLDADMVPKTAGGSFYIRPFMFATEPQLGVSEPLQAKWACFGCPVGSYFNYENGGIRLIADPENVRSWSGGVGQYKMGSNYAPTIKIAKIAAQQKFDQVMWLSGENREITEAGAMNIFVLWTNEENELELITPPVDSGLLLPGITRLSVLELAQELNEMKVSEKQVTMDHLVKAVREDRVHEMFVTGTAALVGPIAEVFYTDRAKNIDETLHLKTTQSKYKLYQRFYDMLTKIHLGQTEKKEWQRIVNL